MFKIECLFEKDLFLNDFIVVLKEEKVVVINLVCLIYVNVRMFSKYVYFICVRVGVCGKGVFLKRFVDLFFRIFIKLIMFVVFCVF